MTLPLDAILGQGPAVARLRSLVAAGRLPHALTFHGPEGVGKATTARALAALLLCEADPRGDSACGSCTACRLIEHGNHPDLLVVERLPKKPGAAVRTDDDEGDEPGDLRGWIVVAQIRELSALAGLAPRRGPRRIFVIDPAHRMNAESQNALLKTLEEPPGGAVIVLVTARPHLLLPTVRSRSFGIGFSAMSAADLAMALERRGMARAEAEARAALAHGRPGRAIELDLPAERAQRSEVLAMLERLGRGPSFELPAMAATLAGEDERTLLARLDLLQELLRDVSRSGVTSDHRRLVHADLEREIATLARSIGPARAAALVASIDALRGTLRFNANRTLIAESLLAAVAGGPLP